MLQEPEYYTRQIKAAKNQLASLKTLKTVSQKDRRELKTIYTGLIKKYIALRKSAVIAPIDVIDPITL